MQFLLLLLVALCITINAKKLTCVVCDYSSGGNSKCDGECKGDICTLVKDPDNNNRTTLADCLNMGPVKEGPAVCHKNYGYIICACSTKDRCNDPTSSLSDFKKLDKEFRHEIYIIPMDDAVHLRQHLRRHRRRELRREPRKKPQPRPRRRALTLRIFLANQLLIQCHWR
ncbi:hypothetical protein V3C99_012307 [Haemonchus contortus]